MSARCLSGLVVVSAKFRSRNAPREKPSRNAAKIVEVEAAVRAANEAVLLHGGRGYTNEYPVEQMPVPVRQVLAPPYIPLQQFLPRFCWASPSVHFLYETLPTQPPNH